VNDETLPAWLANELLQRQLRHERLQPEIRIEMPVETSVPPNGSPELDPEHDRGIMWIPLRD
jgi:hypothetical protein